MGDQDEKKGQEEDLSPDIKDWSKHQVRQWALEFKTVDDDDIIGPSPLPLDTANLKEMGVTFGSAKRIIHARDEVVKLKKEEAASFGNQSWRLCKPYPFGTYSDTHRYTEGYILDVTESGASDLIEPCHEYKAFINTTDDTKLIKFTDEVIRFAAACMNSRTNGTIHFGVGDEPDFIHGQVLGVVVENKEVYDNKLRSAIDGCFEFKHKEAAQMCIKPPRFVGVLNKNTTSSDKCVIEVDIVPDSVICEENNYYTLNKKAKKKEKGKEADKTEMKPSKQLFIRDGGSSRNLLAPTTSDKHMKKYNQFVGGVAKRSQLRKKAEEKHLSVIKSSIQGSTLSQMITGGSLSLDKSHFERYVIVTNKSHSIQLESLRFLVKLRPTAVLDFDPESAKDGLLKYFKQQSIVNAHLPSHYKITEGIEDIADKLKLTRNTSWVLCNGGIKDEVPSDIDQWSKDKGASIRDEISFLCRKDVLANKRCLVIFLILSTVSEQMDPLVETFSTFLRELRGTEQILFICNNKNTFTSWKDLIKARCENDISDRCIYEPSLTEVNGTILSLWSENRKSSRFLTCGGGSKVLLIKEVECSLNTLEILCTNQCEGGNEDKIPIEENFYNGGKVSWWNFYFSKQPGSMRAESSEVTESIDTVFIENYLYDLEKKRFEQKLVEIEKTHKNADTFYGFMIMKKNLKPEYIQGVVHNTLKSFNKNQKHAQLLAVLALLNVYGNGASLSSSLFHNLFGLQPTLVCGTENVEERFEKFSTLVVSRKVKGKVHKAVEIIHPSFAWCCLQEITTTHKMTIAEIINLLLTTDELYEDTEGKDKLMQDVHSILIERHSVMAKSLSHSFIHPYSIYLRYPSILKRLKSVLAWGQLDKIGKQFSRIIQHIERDTPELVEEVLLNASKRFENNNSIAQLQSKYHHLKDRQKKR